MVYATGRLDSGPAVTPTRPRLIIQLADVKIRILALHLDEPLVRWARQTRPGRQAERQALRQTVPRGPSGRVGQGRGRISCVS